MENSGTLDRVVIKDNRFSVPPMRGNFSTPTSVAVIGATAWVIEGNTTYFFDISKKNLAPPMKPMLNIAAVFFDARQVDFRGAMPDLFPT